MEFRDPTVNISGKQYPVSFGFLCFVIFTEKTGGKTLADCKDMRVLLQLYHCAILAGAERHGTDVITFDEFMTTLDDRENQGVFEKIRDIYNSDPEKK